jgi:hypothetical protein
MLISIFRAFSCLLVTTVAILSQATASAQIVDLEDLPLDPESFYNGSAFVEQGGQAFQSGPATFNNYFSNAFGFDYWDNFAYSNTTNITTPGEGNQYSAFTGIGSRESANYAVGFDGGGSAVLKLPEGVSPVSVQLTNTTYTALAVKNGYGVANAFGGATENTPDWLLVTITGRDANGQAIPGMPTVPFYLADYRFGDNSQDYIVDAWKNVNLTSLAGARELAFSVTSSDVSIYDGVSYPNTPTYFALDDLSLTSQTGDVTGDGVVDIKDITKMANSWLKPGPVGDANGDGVVDVQDLTLAANHWLAGSGGGASAPTVVPEPAAGVLALFGLALLPFVRGLARTRQLLRHLSTGV